jgi:LysM repeat protein
MTDKDSAQSVIDAYRKRQQAAQKAPLIIGIAALLLIIGAGALIYWLIGPNKPAIVLFASATPTSTNTSTPSATPTVTHTPTVTPTELPTATGTATPTSAGPFTYQIAEGDTLFSIAQKFKVDLLLLETINNINPASPNIRTGEKLTIPGPSTKLPSATPLPKNLISGTKIKYTVQAGDSLAAIALNLNSTTDAIKKENKITNENEIYPGQVLTIPVNLVTPVPTTGAGTSAAPAQATSSSSDQNLPPSGSGFDITPEGTLLP